MEETHLHLAVTVAAPVLLSSRLLSADRGDGKRKGSLEGTWAAIWVLWGKILD